MTVPTQQDALNTQMFLTGYIAGVLDNAITVEQGSQHVQGGAEGEAGTVVLRTQSGMKISIAIAVAAP